MTPTFEEAAAARKKIRLVVKVAGELEGHMEDLATCRFLHRKTSLQVEKAAKRLYGDIRDKILPILTTLPAEPKCATDCQGDEDSAEDSDDDIVIN